MYFEGVNSVATVFVNHTPVGEHKGGYTAFCHEIRGSFIEGGNLVVVFFSNAWRTDVLPISGDFNVYGGMHRPCRLIITDKDCINPAYYASPGVLIHQKDITRANAEADVEVFLSAKDRRLGVAVSVLDADGRCVAKGRKDNPNVSGNITIPRTVYNGDKSYSVKEIGDGAFDGNQNLKSITIGGYVRKIGNNAFFECKALTTVKMGDYMKEIGGSAFAYCSALTDIKLSGSINTIGAYAFSDCVSLESIKIPLYLSLTPKPCGDA